MREERVAARYGRALFMCVDDDSALMQIEKEMTALGALMSQGSEFRTLLVNPAFRKEEQAKTLEEISKALSLHALTKNLLLLLIENGRIAVLPHIAKSFSTHMDAKLLRVRARVTSASALSSEELDQVVDSLRVRAGKNVVAELEVDARLGMGLKAQIGGLVFDATLSTMLERFKRQLIDTPIGA